MKKSTLDLNEPYVSVGPFQIQGRNFFGLPDEVGDAGSGYAAHWRGRMRHIAGRLGLIYDESRAGVQSGYGHGSESLRLLNPDGSLVFEMIHVNHCEGPGYSCSQ